MTDINSQAEIPIGEAKKLNQLVGEEWQRRLILFSEVKNTVLEVNHDVLAPLHLKEGEPSPLGVFAEAALTEKPAEVIPGKHRLEVWPGHKRTLILGRVIFADKQGRIYRDIDLKGIGMLESGNFQSDSNVQVLKPGGRFDITGGVRGLMDEDVALFDRQVSEEFLEAGIRTSRYIGIIGLEELVIEGEKISLDQAIERGFIDKGFRPVIEVRAFGTKARVRDIEEGRKSQKPEQRKFSDLLLEDAKKMVAQELGRDKLSTEEYLEWFATTLGKNVGLLHQNGWLHNYLLGHNVTLDCRIIDLDSVTELKAERERAREFEKAQSLVTGLAFDITDYNTTYFNSLKERFNEGYNNTFASTPNN